MQALSLEGLCELGASKGASKGAEPALLSICRRHAAYIGHIPWEDSCGDPDPNPNQVKGSSWKKLQPFMQAAALRLVTG